jgi:hypothetical protein
MEQPFIDEYDPEAIIKETQANFLILQIGVQFYQERMIAQPENKEWAVKTKDFQRRFGEIKAIREDCRAAIHERQCLPFLQKLKDLMNGVPLMLDLPASAPNRIFRELNLDLFPETRFSDRFILAYAQWRHSLTPETQKNHTSESVIRMHFSMECHYAITGLTITFSHDHRLIFWRKKAYWAKKGKLPGIVVSDLKACGLNDIEITTLYPGFHL